jgi:hypothetical protein
MQPFATFALASILPIVSAPTAFAQDWDQTIRRLCTSTTQQGCWVKAGAALCDEDQMRCEKLPDHAPARVIKKVGKRWHVQTAFGTGWVSDRMMMTDSRF